MEMFDFKIQFKEGRKREKKMDKIEYNIKMLAVNPNIPVITRCEWTTFSPWVTLKSSYIIFVKEPLKLWV